MTRTLTTLADLLHPVAPETFLEEVYGRKPLHIPGDSGKFAEVLSWRGFTDILNMTGIWSSASLRLKLDRRDVPPQSYCTRAVDRNKQSVLQPVPERVMDWVRQGAALVCNEIESLNPGLRRVLGILERSFGGRANCNLYCSCHGRQAFASHYDKHEAFALQIEGRKHWRIYQGRIENPIHHALFANQTQAFLDRHKGPVMQEITTRPGDLLYLPRGQFRDALADEGMSLHVTYALVVPTGLTVLSDAWERAAVDPFFRADLPFTDAGHGGDGDRRLQRHLAELKERFLALLSGPDFVDRVKSLQRSFPVGRGEYDLPVGRRESATDGDAPPVDGDRYPQPGIVKVNKR